MTHKKLIIGLGNPGQQYELTRHNLGFLVVAKLAEQLKVKFTASSLINGLTAKASDGGQELVLLIPLTFVNNSGNAVKAAVKKYDVQVSNILVICDDLNLPFGQLRIREQGSDGGHNGLKSIHEKIGTKDFARLRGGIGRPKVADDVVDFVLQKFSKVEQKVLPDILEKAADCCRLWAAEGHKKAMELYNRNN